MNRLTDEELREPDVIIRMPIEKWNALPDEAQTLLRFFLKEDRITVLVFRLPAYRWRELQQLA